MTDLPGQAIHDYFVNNTKKKLFVHDEFGPKVEMPLPVYFRDFYEMPELEQKALKLCTGKVLDIGAGAGSHAIELQNLKFNVTALEISNAACDVMRARGVENVVCDDIFEYSNEKFDTLLLLMNGIGLCGTCEGFIKFLKHAEKLLSPGGQIIFDSCDIAYMYEDLPRPEHYYGEVKCCYEYSRQKTEWFHWLYLDFGTMSMIARAAGWNVERIAEDENNQYLARLTRRI